MNQTYYFSYFCQNRLCLHQTRIVHPDVVPRKCPRKDKHIDGPHDHASLSKPGKSRQGFEKRMVQFDSAHRTDRKKSSDEAYTVCGFSAQNALPSVFFKRKYFHIFCFVINSATRADADSINRLNLFSSPRILFCRFHLLRNVL